MELLNNKALEDATIGILKDHIIWKRVSEGMENAINALYPDEHKYEFEPDYGYEGYGNAFLLMGISNEHHLTGLLSVLTIDKLKDNRKKANVLIEKAS